MAADMRHHLRLFNSNAKWEDIATYDEFLFDSIFNKSLTDDLRILAAMNWGIIFNILKMSSRYEDRCYWLFQKIAPEFSNEKAQIT
ncbi:hypothetical protein D1AOALGA4SA_6762 [Olavius algarvensis Delta 1 endosymbiont]|nr:hypothetical protein D1AOALGA4SA_6762 [Olavius algarvensis Delta 1 endosymbiont]